MAREKKANGGEKRRTGRKIVSRVFGVLLIAVIAAFLTLQLPAVQSYLARMAIERLAGNIDGDIRFESVQLRPFHGFTARGLVILDRHPYESPSQGKAPDTLLAVGSASATFSIMSLLSEGVLRIRNAELNDVSVNLVMAPQRDSGDARLNLVRVFGLEEESGDNALGRLHCRSLTVRNARLRYKDYVAIEARDSLEVPAGMDLADLDARFDLSAGDISVGEDRYSAKLRSFTLRERGGLAIASCSGRFSMDPGRAELTQLLVDDGKGTKLDVPRVAVAGENGLSAAMERFADDLGVELELNESSFDIRSLAPVLPEMADRRFEARFAGKAEGTVNNLRLQMFRLIGTDSGLSGLLTGKIRNLSDPERVRFDLSLDNLRASAPGIDRLVSGLSPGTDLKVRQLYQGGPVTASAFASGSLEEMKLRAQARDAAGGRVHFEGSLANLLSDSPIVVDGTAGASRLDLGRILGIEELGDVTAESRLTAELKPSGPEAKIYSFNLSQLEFAGYRYGQVYATGILGPNFYKGSIVSRDPNLDFLFGGQITLPTATQDGKYAFTADVGYVDLSALHLDSREVAQMDFRLVADYRQTPDGDFHGDVHVRNLNLKDEAGMHHVGNVSIRSSSAEGDHRMDLTSRFATGTFRGTESVGRFITDLLDATVRKDLPTLAGEPAGEPEGRGSYRLDFLLGNTREILPFFVPDMYVAENSRFGMELGADGLLDAQLTSDGLVYGSVFAKNLDVNLGNAQGWLSADAFADEVGFGELSFRENNLSAYAAENAVDVRYDFDIEGAQPGDRGDLHVRGFLSRDTVEDEDEVVLTADIPSSRIVFYGTPWDLVTSRIRYRDQDLSLDGLQLSSGAQSLRADGRICPVDDGVLNLLLSDFDLSLVNRLLAEYDLGLDLQGRLSGRAQLVSPYDDIPNVVARLTSENTNVGGYSLGTLGFDSEYQEDEERFFLRLRDEARRLSASGFFYPTDGTVDVGARLAEFPLGCISPMLTSVFSDFEGNLSGSVDVTGPLASPLFTGTDLRVSDGLMQLAFSEVPYFMDGELLLQGDRMLFDSLKVRDRYDGKARVRGGLYYPGLTRNGFSYRMDIDAEKLECLDLGRQQGENFYGNLFGTGNVLVDGNFDRLGVKVDARTSRSGTLHIPFDYSVDATAGDLLRFTEPPKEVKVNPLDSIITRKRNVEETPTAIDLDLRINATPDAQVLLELDPSTGNVLSARGDGRIDIGYHNDDFTISGDYTVSSGNYHFSAIVAARDFDIESGSTLHFNGDIYDTDLDIKAKYATRASLAPLLADSTTTRVPVECKIAVTEKLRNPAVELSIEVPQLDPTSQGMVSAALNNQDNIQRQFLALLLSGNFLPSEQSGVTGSNSNLLFSNVSGIMSDQLNNILQSLGIPLDFGLNYEPTDAGNDLFDVAISTQLFNDRVIVNGSVGNRRYTSAGQGDVAGDLDIAVKLNKSGSVRATFFSHSTDQYTNYLDTSQRNGAGFSFQREFSSFGSFFRSLIHGQGWHSSRETVQNGEDVTITINPPEHVPQRRK